MYTKKFKGDIFIFVSRSGFSLLRVTERQRMTEVHRERMRGDERGKPSCLNNTYNFVNCFNFKISIKIKVYNVCIDMIFNLKKNNKVQA